MAAAKSLTHAEIERALEYIASNANAQRNRVMFLLTTNAGLRVSEVADLKLADVLDRDGTLRSEVLLAAERVKHGHSRTVFLNTAIRTELAAYIQSRSWIDAQQPLFTTHRGPRYPFSANTLAQYFYWMYRRAGIKGASSHSGRKTFLTSLAGKGVSVFVLAALAGHRDIKTTSRYVTVNDDVKRSAVELI